MYKTVSCVQRRSIPAHLGFSAYTMVREQIGIGGVPRDHLIPSPRRWEIPAPATGFYAQPLSVPIGIFSDVQGLNRSPSTPDTLL